MNAAPFLFDALRGGTLLGTALLVVAVLARVSAKTRRSVLVAAIAAALLAPFAARILAASRATAVVDLPFLSVVPVAEPMGVESDVVALPVAPGVARETAEARGASVNRRRLPSVSGATVLTTIWFLGAGFVLARLGYGLSGVRRLRRRAQKDDATPFAEVIARTLHEAQVNAEVAISDDVATPAVVGLFRAMVLMPRAALAWDESRWRVVLLHELAHVRGRDCFVGLAGQLLCAMHWFDPLAWLTRARWRKERELAADEDVVARGVRPSDYAAHLLAVAAVIQEKELPHGALAMAGRRSDIVHRLETLLRRGAARPTSPRAVYGVATAACVLTLIVACAGPADHAAPEGRHAAGMQRMGTGSATQVAPLVRSAPPVAGSLVKLADQVAEIVGSPVERNELTIDPRLQAIADDEVARVIASFHAHAATAIILDPAKGEFLAIAGPDTARQGFITGSTMKALTMATALDLGAVTVGQKIDARPRPSEHPAMRDATPHGWMELGEIMEVSSNVGALRVYQALGDHGFRTGLDRFRLGDDGPFAQLGYKRFSPGHDRRPLVVVGEEAEAAVGEGVVSSPLQMIAAYAVFANGGEYVEPSLVRRVYDEAGGIAWRHVPNREPVIRADTASAVIDMLERAVDGPRATGKAARLKDVRVAGKTGTSVVDDRGESQVYASFIGIVPADAPRYVVLVGVVDPDGGASGGVVAAPAFARIVSRALALSE